MTDYREARRIQGMRSRSRRKRDLFLIFIYAGGGKNDTRLVIVNKKQEARCGAAGRK
jgi:hypothetical protein